MGFQLCCACTSIQSTYFKTRKGFHFQKPYLRFRYFTLRYFSKMMLRITFCARFCVGFRVHFRIHTDFQELYYFAKIHFETLQLHILILQCAREYRHFSKTVFVLLKVFPVQNVPLRAKQINSIWSMMLLDISFTKGQMMGTHKKIKRTSQFCQFLLKLTLFEMGHLSQNLSETSPI